MLFILFLFLLILGIHKNDTKEEVNNFVLAKEQGINEYAGRRAFFDGELVSSFTILLGECMSKINDNYKCTDVPQKQLALSFRERPSQDSTLPQNSAYHPSPAHTMCKICKVFFFLSAIDNAFVTT